MKEKCPFEAWQLIQAKEILKWVRDNSQFGINSINLIEIIEDLLLYIAHDKLGLKPHKQVYHTGTTRRT